MNDNTFKRPLRWGLVGGGQGAFIGAVHRIAARLDAQYVMVAGALSSDPERARASGAELGIAPRAVEAIVPSYLYRFRKGGQYAATPEGAI